MQKTLLFFGPAGSGKGSQAAPLASVLGGCHLSTGVLFRSIPPHNAAQQEINRHLCAGKLVPDTLTMRIVLEYINGLYATFQLDTTQWLILDGLPRTPKQAQLIQKQLDIAAIFHFTIDDATCMQRLLHRATCENRSDDTTAIIEKRLKNYRATEQEILAQFPPQLIYQLDADVPRLALLRTLLAHTQTILDNYA